jgi:hypothetical protein
LDQDPPPPIDEVGEERLINHLWTNTLAPEKPPRLGRQRKPATHRETDLVRSEERRENQAANLKDQQAHDDINSETPP